MLSFPIVIGLSQTERQSTGEQLGLTPEQYSKVLQKAAPLLTPAGRWPGAARSPRAASQSSGELKRKALGLPLHCSSIPATRRQQATGLHWPKPYIDLADPEVLKVEKQVTSCLYQEKKHRLT